MDNVPSVREPIHAVHLSQRLPVRFFYQSHGHRGLEDCTRRDENECMKQGVMATRTSLIDAPCGMMRRGATKTNRVWLYFRIRRIRSVQRHVVP